MSRAISCAVVATASIVCTSLADAATRQVPAQFATIQAAVDASSTGDAIEVGPGTYGKIDYLGKGVRIVSTDGPDATIIDAAGADTAVRMVMDEPASAALEGFTVRNGAGATTCCHAGGLTCVGCFATIRNNVFESNFGYAGGISVSPVGNVPYGTPAEPRIEDNEFRGNTAFEHGGGVACLQSRPLIQGNLFHDNLATGRPPTENDGPSGGAIYVVDVAGVQFLDNVLADNDAQHGGGGIFVIRAGGLIEGNKLVRNRARFGAGVHVEKTVNGTVTLRDNVFFANQTEKTPAFDANDSEITLGAAIGAFEADTVIEGNRIVRNRGTSAVCVIGQGPGGPFVQEGCSFGGALALFGGSATVEGNLIAHNESELGGAGWLSQAGLSLEPLVVRLQGNVVSLNHAKTGFPGFMCERDATCVFDANAIVGNTLLGMVSPTDNFAAGGGITFSSTDPSVVTNNVIADNQGQFGAGIAVISTDVAITNNTIAANHPTFVAPDGFNSGSVFLMGGGTAIALSLENNILLGNDGVQIREFTNVTTTVRNNLFFQRGSGAWSVPQGGPPLSVAALNARPGAAANFEDDPAVRARALCADYHIGANSAARDAGRNDAGSLPLLDFDGDARPGATIDVGADEYAEPEPSDCPGVAQAGLFAAAIGKFLLDSDADGALDESIDFGAAGDVPLHGDFIGTGFQGIAVYRPSQSQFLIDRDRDGAVDRSVVLAGGGDQAVVGDWDGDGVDDLGVYDDATHEFKLEWTGDTQLDQTVSFGAAGDVPLAGDWDGDGITDLGVYRPFFNQSAGAFLLDVDRDGVEDATLFFGPAGATPLTGDWNGDGVDDIGVHLNGAFLFDLDGDGAPDRSVGIPLPAGALPVTAHWAPEPNALGLGLGAWLALTGLAQLRQSRRDLRPLRAVGACK